MIENNTPVVLDDGREGIVVNKRRVPKSNPIAWEYQVQIGGYREWVGKYDLKLKSPQERLVEEAARFRTEATAAQFKWEEHEEFPVKHLMVFFGDDDKVYHWWDEASETRIDSDLLYSWVRSGGPLRDRNPIYLTVDDDGVPQALWDGWHRSAAALLSHTKTIFAVVGRKKHLRT